MGIARKTLSGLLASALAAGLLMSAPPTAEADPAGVREHSHKVSPPQSLKIATFNVEKTKDARGGRRAWLPRRAAALRLVRRSGADLVVLQESDGPGYKYRNGVPYVPSKRFPAGWLAAKAGYAVVPHGRKDATTRYVTVDGPHVLYNPRRLSIDMSGKGPGGSARTRDAVFTDKRTGRRFVFVGVHLVGTGASDYRERRRLEAFLLHDRVIKGRSAADQALPTIYGGDFNTFRTINKNPRVTRELRRRGLVDAVTVAKTRKNHRINTFNGLRRDVNRSGRRIDQIWVPKGTAVAKWNQIANIKRNRYVGRFASDHNLVVITATLPR